MLPVIAISTWRLHHHAVESASYAVAYLLPGL